MTGHSQYSGQLSTVGRRETGATAAVSGGTSPRAILLNIQFLRFVAATMVLLLHGAQSYRNMGGQLDFVSSTRYFGFAGVDIFFVISGFIIWTTNLETKGARQNFQYLYRRLARIYLGYWPFFGIALAARMWTSSPLLERIEYLHSFFLLPQTQTGQLIHVSWTLSFELYFYGLFFLALFSANRARLLGVATVLVIAANVYAHVALDAFSPKGFRNLTVLQRFLISPSLIEFFLGCYLAHGIASGWKRFGKAAVALGLAILTFGAVGEAFGFPRVPLFHHAAVFGVGSAVLIYGLVIVEREGLVIWPRFSALMGGASYSIYLCHTIFLYVFSSVGVFAAVRDSAFPALLGYLLLVLLVLAFSALFYVRVERPVYRFAKSLPARFFGA